MDSDKTNDKSGVEEIPIPVEPGQEGNRRPIQSLLQAQGIMGQGRRQHRNLTAREIERGCPLAGRLVKDAVRWDGSGYIRDVNTDPDRITLILQAEGVVKILRQGTIDRKCRQGPQILTFRRVDLCRSQPFGGSQGLLLEFDLNLPPQKIEVLIFFPDPEPDEQAACLSDTANPGPRKELFPTLEVAGLMAMNGQLLQQVEDDRIRRWVGRALASQNSLKKGAAAHQDFFPTGLLFLRLQDLSDSFLRIRQKIAVLQLEMELIVKQGSHECGDLITRNGLPKTELRQILEIITTALIADQFPEFLYPYRRLQAIPTGVRFLQAV